MLVNLPFITSDPIAVMIARLNGSSGETKPICKGVYEVGHFNLGNCIQKKNEYPDFKDCPGFNCYGVCDNYQQVLEKCPEIEQSDRKFVISITPVLKESQSWIGGWRWEKWGPYIGEQKPATEYLYDDPVIEKVYVYHVYEV